MVVTKMLSNIYYRMEAPLVCAEDFLSCSSTKENLNKLWDFQGKPEQVSKENLNNLWEDFFLSKNGQKGKMLAEKILKCKKKAKARIFYWFSLTSYPAAPG